MLRCLLLALLLSACGTTPTGSTPTETDEASGTPSSVPSATPDPEAVDETRAIVRGGLSAASRQLDGWEGRITTLRDHAITRNYEDGLTAIGEEMLDWIEERREELVDAVSGPCIEDALTAYEDALDELETTTERLFEAGQDADSRVVRAIAALEDAAEALDGGTDALPASCRQSRLRTIPI